ncbi:MAG: hypothetical protein EBU06_01955 [Micrococcales bacterium]|nr:hypothetical protein [Micrococcales bacterium]NBY43536.1 hypothetical protein [Micrococcales bacterium]
MEFLGSGGFALLLIAIAWLGFMTPTGQRSVKVSKKSKARPVKAVRVRQNPATIPSAAISRVVIGEQAGVTASEAPEKVVVNRLPDPLSARLGTIENVPWAQVHNLEKIREEIEQTELQNLDEILQRRRSNG